MSSGGATYGQGQSKKYTQQALSTARGAEATYLNSPFYQGILPIAQNIINNPDVYSHSDIQRIEDNSAAQGVGAYQSAIQRTNERAASTGAYRSGSAREGERLAASDLGAGLASADRQTETMALSANRASNLAAVNLGNQMAGIPYGMSMNEANILTGAAANPVWQAQNDQFGQGMAGLGSLLGLALAPATGGTSLTTPLVGGGMSTTTSGARIGSRLSG